MIASVKQQKEPIAESDVCSLFPDFPASALKKPRRYKRILQPIWTEDKAKFIQVYLRYFVQITKHGAYIDGFAGPQNFDQPNSWAAALVLQSEPKWLRHFFLCELRKKSVKALEALVQEQPRTDTKGRKLQRKIEICPGDFNTSIDEILKSQSITQKEATFCLLDQWTFECHWDTLKKLAGYKQAPNNKIELLYFLGVGWMHRAFSGIRKNTEKAEKWWGRPDWRDLKTMPCQDIADLVRKRFERELEYRYVAAYPIFDKKKGNRVMYYMIHASDHDEAPALMVRAHNTAVRSLPKEVQQPLEFDHD